MRRFSYSLEMQVFPFKSLCLKWIPIFSRRDAQTILVCAMLFPIAQLFSSASSVCVFNVVFASLRTTLDKMLVLPR